MKSGQILSIKFASNVDPDNGQPIPSTFHLYKNKIYDQKFSVFRILENKTAGKSLLSNPYEFTLPQMKYENTNEKWPNFIYKICFRCRPR